LPPAKEWADELFFNRPYRDGWSFSDIDPAKRAFPSQALTLTLSRGGADAGRSRVFALAIVIDPVDISGLFIDYCCSVMQR
jgi:hypothetical protein